MNCRALFGGMQSNSDGLARRGVLLGGMAEDWHWIDGSEKNGEGKGPKRKEVEGKRVEGKRRESIEMALHRNA